MTPSTGPKSPTMAASTPPKTLGPPAPKPGDITKSKSSTEPGSSPPNSNPDPITKTPPKNTVSNTTGGRKHKKRLTKKRNRRYKR